MYDKGLLNMENLEIIITALASSNLIVEGRLLPKTVHSVDIIPSLLLESERLGKCKYAMV